MAIDKEIKRKQNREMYQFYKSRGMCPRCRKRKAAIGFVLCPECIEHNTLSSITRDKERARQYNAEWRRRRKETGMCTYCKGTAEPGHTLCTKCLASEKRRNQARYVRAIKPDGICRWCDKEVVPGKKYCPEHYQKKLEVMNMPHMVAGREKGRETHARTEEAFWKEMRRNERN